MKKIKFISNFTDGTGWAKAATYSALALSSIYDVACEEKKYNDANIELEEDLRDLFKKSGPFDYTIHHVLPTDYIKLPNTVNVGFLPVEATISNKQWLKNIKMMDFMIVPDHHSAILLARSGIDNVKILPYNFNYHKTVGYQDSIKIHQIEGSFNFLFVGEFCARKNIETLIRAFYSEFHYKENVNLVIKTSGDPNRVNQLCTHVEQQCRKNTRYKRPIIITGYLKEQDLISITRQCHAFVTASHGEAWCYPAIESLACGLDVIYPHLCGIYSYAPKTYSVDSYLTNCYGGNDAVAGLYTCEDLWTEINIRELMGQMRNVVSKGPLQNKASNMDIARTYDYRSSINTRGIFE